MLSLEEREIRRKQLGASEVYKLFNFDSQEAQDLWELKVGLQDYQELDSDAITAGNILEEECLKYYANTHNVELVYNERIEGPFEGLVVSLDARAKNTNYPVENKVVNEKTWDSWKAKRDFNAIYGTEKLNIPKSYYYQLQTQMWVLDVDYGILNVNTLTDEEQEDPINVVITDLHNKPVIIERNDLVIMSILKRVRYMLNCMKYKIRPSELDYLEKEVF